MCARNPEGRRLDGASAPVLYKIKLVFLCVLSISLAGSAHAAAKQIELEPVTPWHVEWTDETCVMRRGFGAKEELLVLQIERFGPSDRFQMVVTGPQLRTAQRTGRLSIEYGDSGYVDKVEQTRYGSTKDGIPTVFVSQTALVPLSNEDAASIGAAEVLEKGVDWIGLTWWSKRTLKLKTGPLDRAFTELRKCTDDLLRVWMLDPEEQKSLSRPPMPIDSPGDWIRSGDYPRSALLDGAQSLNNFVLIIGPDGVPRDCKIQRSYSGNGFDKRTCTLLMKRARFRPALNSQGNPVSSFYFNTVNWIIR